jgi:hypothetical protein
MKGDPKRWMEDDEAPASMRAYLQHASPREVTLTDAQRAQMRRAILGAHERESSAAPVIAEREERIVAAPTELTRRAAPRRAVVFAMLAAAIVLLGVVVYGREPRVPPPAPAVAPEPVDAGPDAPVLEVIEVERICGDREDSDLQCDLVARPSHPYERIELHAASGVRAPGCDGVAEQHREPVEGEPRFVLSHGGSWDGQRAFTVCGYRGGVLMGMGSVEGHRNFPQVALASRRGGDDVRIPLDAIDADITRVELRWVAEMHRDDTPQDGCPGERVASVTRAEMATLVGREGLALFRHVRTPEGRDSAFLICAFSDAGVSNRRAGYHFPEDEQPFLRTVSGELPLGEIRTDVAVLGPDGLVTVSHLDAAWPGSAANRRTVDRMLARMETGGVTPARELVLANGQTLILPRGARLGPRSLDAEPRVATLRDGTTTEIVSEHPVEPPGGEGDDRFRVARNALLTSSSEACVYLDDVVVALFATGDEAPRPVATEVPEPIRVVPQTAYECHVEVLLEVEDVPSDIESIAIAFVRPGADVDFETRPVVDCATASIAMELPASAIASLSPDARGVRQLALTFSDAPDDFNDLRDEGEYCMAPYAVIACVRDAGGLHALPGATGRWTHSGMACFAGDTPVATDDGSVPIASLRAGHRVWAFDPNRSETALTTVTRLIPRGERAVLTFTLSSGTALRVTPEHPLFDSVGRIFRQAETFVVGDRLRGIDGSDVTVMEIGVGDRTPVFDLSVAGPHTYFAGGIVAHNY